MTHTFGDEQEVLLVHNVKRNEVTDAAQREPNAIDLKASPSMHDSNTLADVFESVEVGEIHDATVHTTCAHAKSSRVTGMSSTLKKQLQHVQ